MIPTLFDVYKTRSDGSGMVYVGNLAGTPGMEIISESEFQYPLNPNKEPLEKSNRQGSLFQCNKHYSGYHFNTLDKCFNSELLPRH